MSRRELVIIAAVLLTLAAALHFTHYLIFHDPHHVFIYMFGDIAFLPIEILVISIVVDRVLRERERERIRHKMNMVIGAFFSTLGQPLLELLPGLLANADEVLPSLAVAPDWDVKQIAAAGATARTLHLKTRPTIEHFEALRALLTDHRDFILRLLENPILLERDEFSDLLWAISHVGEELAARPDLSASPESDLRHLAGDVNRLYARLLPEWLEYMVHLKTHYPFLYSFVSRTNPLRADRDPIVRE